MITALFGFGRAGKIHYHNLKDYNLEYVVELIDVSEQMNNASYIDFNDKISINQMLKQIDVAIITTPTSTHYQLIMLCLKNNVHVFVEKPIVDDYHQINQCFDLAEKNKLKLMVGYNRRFDPILMKIKKEIDQGKIGNVNTALTISRDYPYPKPEYMAISGGIFHDCATHDIDYMNWILDSKPTKVMVTVNETNHDYCFDHTVVTLTYPKTIATLHLSRISQSYDQRCEFYGDLGEIRNNNYNSEVIASFPERYAIAFKNEIEYFFNCIENNVELSITREHCLINHIISDCCQKSVVESKIIDIKY